MIFILVAIFKVFLRENGLSALFNEQHFAKTFFLVLFCVICNSHGPGQIFGIGLMHNFVRV